MGAALLPRVLPAHGAGMIWLCWAVTLVVAFFAGAVLDRLIVMGALAEAVRTTKERLGGRSENGDH